MDRTLCELEDVMPQVLIPGPDHPITVEPGTEHVVVRIGDTVVADTHAPLVLRESTYPPAYYLPPDSVDAALLRPSETTTHCPYKGDATYRSVETDNGTVQDAMWVYEHPHDAVAQIEGHFAFYPDRVQLTVED